MKIMKLEQILLNVKQINNMIKVVNPSVEVWKQEGYDLDSILNI